MGNKSFIRVFIVSVLVVAGIIFLLNIGKYIAPETTNNLLRVDGSKIYTPSGNIFQLKGIALPNGVYNIRDPYMLVGSHYELKTADYSRIKALGLNSVRFYIQYNWLNDDNEYDFFQYLDSQIALAKEHNVYLILNLHFFGMSKRVNKGLDDGFYKGNKKYNLVSFWKKISDRYKDEPIIAAYDLLNEPSTSSRLSEKQLYDYYQKMIKAIRDNGDNHIVIVSDPVNKFAVELKKDIKKSSPFQKMNDNNCIYQFHWYEPIEFTHQGFFESDYFDLGATYPTERIFDKYKGGYYKNPYVSDTKGLWVKYKTAWVDLNKANCDIDFNKDKFNLSLSFTGLKGKVWFDDIELFKKDSAGVIRKMNVPNGDIRNSRSFVGWVKDPKPSTSPAKWTLMANEETTGIKGSIDWENDYSLNGSGSLYVDARNAIWKGENQWAVWGQSGGAISAFYNIEEDAKYQATCWVKTMDNPNYNVSVGFGIYEVKEILFNKFTIKNLIHEYYVKWGKKNNVPLFCGEFGTTNPGLLQPTVSSRQQAKWVFELKDILDKEVANWSYHSYKSYSPRSDLFGLFNANQDKQIQNILKIKTSSYSK